MYHLELVISNHSTGGLELRVVCFCVCYGLGEEDGGSKKKKKNDSVQFEERRVMSSRGLVCNLI